MGAQSDPPPITRVLMELRTLLEGVPPPTAGLEGSRHAFVYRFGRYYVEEAVDPEAWLDDENDIEELVSGAYDFACHCAFELLEELRKKFPERRYPDAEDEDQIDIDFSPRLDRFSQVAGALQQCLRLHTSIREELILAQSRFGIGQNFDTGHDHAPKNHPATTDQLGRLLSCDIMCSTCRGHALRVIDTLLEKLDNKPATAKFWPNDPEMQRRAKLLYVIDKAERDGNLLTSGTSIETALGSTFRDTTGFSDGKPLRNRRRGDAEKRNGKWVVLGGVPNAPRADRVGRAFLATIDFNGQLKT